MNLDSLTKEEALAVCNTKQQWTGAEVKRMLSSMKSRAMASTEIIKVGDVLLSKALAHPFLVVKIVKDGFVGLLMTTEPNTPSIITQCKSRFFSNSYITSTMIVNSVQGSVFMCPYDNPKDLARIKRLYLLNHKKLFRYG